MIKTVSVISFQKIVVVASIAFTANAFASDIGRLYRYTKLPSITPFEKHCVSTSSAGKELRRCLDSQPKTKAYLIERSRSQARLDILDEIAYDIGTTEVGKTPWETFCDNTTSEASLCLYYCYEGWVCPY